MAKSGTKAKVNINVVANTVKNSIMPKKCGIKVQRMFFAYFANESFNALNTFLVSVASTGAHWLKRHCLSVSKINATNAAKVNSKNPSMGVSPKAISSASVMVIRSKTVDTSVYISECKSETPNDEKSA